MLGPPFRKFVRRQHHYDESSEVFDMTAITFLLLMNVSSSAPDV